MRADTSTGGIASPAPGSPPAAAWRRWVALGVALLALIVLGRWLGGYLPRFAAWVQGMGAWGPVLFVCGYAVAAVAFVPGALLTLVAGAIFGVGQGTVYVFVGETLGSAIAFLLARWVARAAVERRLAASPRFAAIDHAVAAHGRRIIFLLRLSPGFPFNALNYALGLTKIRFIDYLVASVGMLPGTLLYAYYGQLAGEVAVLAGGAPVQRGTAYYVVFLIGLAATVIVTALVTGIARRALKEAAAE